MVTGVLRRLGDSYVVEVPRDEVHRLHLREGEVVTLDLRPGGAQSADHREHDSPPVEDETAHLLRSPRNRARLLAAMAQAERGDGVPLTRAEVRKELGLAEKA